MSPISLTFFNPFPYSNLKRKWSADTCQNDFQQYGTFLKSPNAKLIELEDEMSALAPMVPKDEDHHAIKSEVFHVIELGVPAIVDKHAKHGYDKICDMFYPLP